MTRCTIHQRTIINQVNFFFINLTSSETSPHNRESHRLFPRWVHEIVANPLRTLICIKTSLSVQGKQRKYKDWIIRLAFIQKSFVRVSSFRRRELLWLSRTRFRPKVRTAREKGITWRRFELSENFLIKPT